jgi:hypothetical protein
MFFLPVLFLVIVLFLAGWAGFAISGAVNKTMLKSGKSNPKAIKVVRIVTLIGSFTIIVGLAYLFFAYGFRLER